MNNISTSSGLTLTTFLINNDSITLQETLMPKVLKSFCWKPKHTKHTQNQFSLTLFWDIGKTLQTCYFGNFWHVLPHMPKMIVSIWKNLSSLYLGKKSTSSFMFSLRYCKDIAKLLFMELWVCPALSTQSDTINLQKTFVFICGQKFKFIPHVFLEVL